MRSLTALIAIAAAAPAMAQTPAPTFAGVFGDHAVLQRDTPVTIWGKARPGARLTVTLADRRVTATAGRDGRWEARLPALPAGGPYTLAVADGVATTTLSDVMLGDVWLCSGQSNMEFRLRNATNAGSETKDDPLLRYIVIPRAAKPTLQAEIDAPSAWRVTTADNAGDSSAVCHVMARELRRTQNVAIGTIQASWGGTGVAAWTSADALARFPDYRAGLATLRTYDRSPDEAVREWNVEQARWWAANEPDAAAKAAWARPDYDDSGWGEIESGRDWSAAGIPELVGFDGIVWHRAIVTLTPEQAASAIAIEMGGIDDNDNSFVNGVRVGGEERSSGAKRRYPLPAGTLHAGRNVVAVQIYDAYNEGGLTGPAAGRCIVLADGSTIPLPTRWKYRISAPIDRLAHMASQPWRANTGSAVLYNGMIAPIAPYALKGVAWYQGENNVNDAADYARVLPAMIADWRRSFADPTLPFLIVQLTAFGPPAARPQHSGWGAIRDVQRRVAAADPRVGLAVTLDVGDRYDIHPSEKRVVGQRLAIEARRIAYGDTSAVGSPAPFAATRRGDMVTVRFSGTAPLRSFGAAQAIGFELCDAARTCRWAPGVAEGTTVRIAGAGATDRFVRYAWADTPSVNLFADTGLPVGSFELPIS